MVKRGRWRERLLRGLGLISLPLALVLLMLWRPQYQPPIFDAQVHYNDNAWKRVRIEAIRNGIEELNVPWLLVGSTPNEGTWRLQRALPDRVIPMWVPELPRGERESWARDPQQIRAMQRALERRPYRGVGELWLAGHDSDTPGVDTLLRLAREHELVLHLRTDPTTLAELLAKAPRVKILWAHAGVDVPAWEVERLLWRYPQLWIELSHRYDATRRGRLHPDWRRLIENHPTRVLVGTGTYTADDWFRYRTILSQHRRWLNRLPPQIRDRVAYENGRALFQIARPRTSSQPAG